MRNIKKVALMSITGILLGTASVSALSNNNGSPAETVAELTGQTIEEVISERRENNTSYGQMAINADKLEEFKLERTKFRKDRLAQKVEEGIITQDEADAKNEMMQEHQENCDGSGQGGEHAMKENRQHQGQGSQMNQRM